MKRAAGWFGPLCVFAFGFALVMHAGRMGYMPLDQSIVFDGAWRVLCGQVPYRDFVTPNGLTPIYLQVPFFALFGATWFAFVLHAALANGVFGLLVFALLRQFELGRLASLAYAALSCVIFYPPMGTPYLEQHGFLFSLAAIVAAIAAAREEPGSKRSNDRWFLVPVLLAAAWFAKQIPSVFAVPIVLAIWLSAGRAQIGRGAIAMLAGTLFVAAALALAIWLAGVDLHLLWDYHVRLPAAEGEFKRKFLPTFGAFAERVWDTSSQSQLFSLEVASLCLPLVALAAFVAVLVRREATEQKKALAAALLGLALVAVCLCFTSLTGNQWQNGIPFAFVSVGLLAVALQRLVRTPVIGHVWLFVAHALSFALFVGVACDAWRFQRDVVETRLVNDLTFDGAAADAASTNEPEALAYLRWSLPTQFEVTAGDFRDVAKFLGDATEDFVLLGDMTVLNALARKSSRMPSLWLHPGLTMPWPEDPAFADFEARVAAPFEDGSARWLVLEGERTFTHRRLEDFPKLDALVKTRGKIEHRFGFFRVIDLGTPTKGG